MKDGISNPDPKDEKKPTELPRIRISLGPVRTVLIMVPFLLAGVGLGVYLGYRHIKSERILDLTDISFGQLALDTYAGCVEARNSLQVVLNIDRNNPRGKALLSLVLARLASEYDGEPKVREEASSLFQEASLDLEKNSEILPVLLWTQYHLSSPNISDALKENLEASLKLLPNHPLLLALAGELQSNQRQYEQARTLWEQSLEKDPSNVHVVYQLGRLEESLDRMPRAAERFQQALRLNNLHVGSLLSMARLRIKQKKELDLAKNDLEKAVTLQLIVPRDKAQAHRLLAEVNFFRALRKEALEEVRTAIRLRPDDAAFQYELAELCLKFFELDVAADLAKKVMQLTPENASAKLLLIRCHLPRGQAAAALKALDALIGQRVLAVPFFLLRGETYLALGQYQSALADFQAIGENETEKPIARAFAALACLGVGEIDTAYKEALALTKDKPALSLAHFALGRVLSSMKNEWKAIEAYKRAVELDPRCYQCITQLATISLGRNKLAEAEELLQASLNANPYDSESNLLLGNIKLSLKNPEAALEKFSHLVQLEPGNLGGLIGATEALLLLGRNDQALQFAEKARAVGRVENAHEWYIIGKANLISGKFKQALRDLTAAQRLGDNDPELLADLGVTHLSLGMTTAAEKSFTESLKRKKLRRSYEGFAKLLMLEGKFGEGGNAFEQAALLAAGQKAPAQEIYQLYLEGGRSWLREKRARDSYTKARRLFGLARKRVPQEIEPLFQIAVTWEMEKRFDQARKSYAQVLDMKSDYREALYRLGMLELEAKNTGRAKELLQLFVANEASAKDPRTRQVSGLLDKLK